MGARIKGLTIEIDGKTTKLQQALSQVENKTRSMKNGLRDVDRLLKFDPRNTELLRQKQDMLGKAITSSKDKLKQLNEAMDQMKKQDGFDENSEDAQRLKREIIATEQEIQRLEQRMAAFGSVGKQQMRAVGESMQQIGHKISDAGKSISNVGSQMTQKLTLPIALASAAAVKSFAEVDKTMTLTNQTMGNTEAQAKELSNAMKDAASNSTFGMNDAAQASLNFARAGLDATQAADTLAPAMNLAAGEGGNLDTVSAGLVATINGFHGSFSDAAKYADVFANACNNSALDIDGLSNAMSVAAPVFSAAGYSVNDAALYMGIMANNGIEADKAANSLKTGLARLVKPSKEGAEWLDKLGVSLTDQNGMMKDTVTVQGELNAAFSQLSEAEQIAAASAIFGKNQMAPWLALINAAPADVSALNDQLKQTGTTTEMAEAMMSGFGGSLEKLKSSLDVAKTSFGEALAPTISKIADAIQNAIDKFNALSDEEKEHIAKTALLVAAAGPAVMILGKLTTGVGTLVTGMGKAVVKISEFGSGLGMLGAGPAAAAILATVGLSAAVIKYAADAKQARIDSYGLTEAEQEHKKALEDATRSYTDAISARDKAVQQIGAEYGQIESLKNEYNGLIDKNGEIKAGYEARADYILTTLAEALGVEKEKILEQADANGQLGSAIDAVIAKKEAQAWLDANYDAYTESLKMQTENTQLLAQALQDLQTKEAEEATAKAEVQAAQDALNNSINASPAYTRRLMDNLEEAKEHYAGVHKATQDVAKSVDEYTSKSQQAAQEVTQYENMKKAVYENNEAAIRSQLEQSSLGLKSATTATKDELKKQADAAYKEYESLKKARADGEKGITDEMIKWAENRAKKADELAGVNVERATKEGEDTVGGYTRAIEKGAPASEKAAADAKANAIASLEDKKKEAQKHGGALSKLFAGGVYDFMENAVDASAEMRDAAIGAADTGNNGSVLGSNFGSGFAAGISSWIVGVQNAAASLASTAVSSVQSMINSHSPSKVTQKLGEYFGQGFAIGIKGEIGTVSRMADSMARAAITAASGSPYTNPLTFMNGERYAPGAVSNQNNVTQHNTITFNVTGENPAAIIEQLAAELNMMARMA